MIDSKVTPFKKFIFLTLSLMLLIFCVTKVLRGSDTSIETQGGIWNYISFLYYPIVFFAIVQNQKSNISSIFLYCSLYTVIAFISTIIYFPTEVGVGTIYKMFMIPYFALVFSCFYNFSFECKKAENLILLAFFICLSINLITILEYQIGGAARPLASDIYFSLSLFPFALVFIKNAKIRTIAIIAMFFASFFSGKRTCFLAFVFAFVVFILIDSYLQSKSAMVSAIKSLFIIGVAVVVFYFISKYFDESFDLGIYERLGNLFEDGGSGRDKVYSTVWEDFKNSNLLEKIIGHGMGATGDITSAYAHNDFLEIVYNYGIFAVLFVALLYLNIFRRAIGLIRDKSPYAPAFFASFIIAIFLSMFSYFLVFYTYVTGLVAFWGYALALENQRKNNM